MADASGSRPAPSRTLPKDTPLWLQLPADFASLGAKELVCSSEVQAGLLLGKAEASTSSCCGGKRRQRMSDSGSTIEVLAVSFSDGPRLSVYSQQADAWLKISQRDKVEYVDDSDWMKFPAVGAALKKLASKEDCFTGAFCPKTGTWAFGVGMMSISRHSSAKVALAVSLAMQQADGPSGEDLSSFRELDSFARQVHEHHAPRWTALKSLINVNIFTKLHCQLRAWFYSWSLSGKYLHLSSPCGGAVEGWAPLRNERADDKMLASFDGFCVCCKRPLTIALKDAPPMSDCKRRKTERCAYVCAVWGEDPQYVLGAMVLGYSLRQTGTPHDLVLMYTKDVPSDALALLGRAGWRIRSVDYVVASPMLFSNPGNRFAGVFTKLRALELVEYSKVLLLDSDLLVRDSIDHLFDLPAPAAMHRGIACGYAHGAKIDGRQFFGGSRPGYDYYDDFSPAWHEVAVRGPWSWGQAGGINAGVMLFTPSLETSYQCLSEVTDGMHPEHIRGSGPEQDYLSRFFASDWTHISVAYNFQLHQMYYALGGIGGIDAKDVSSADRKEFLITPNRIKVFHFSSDPKPWTRRLDARYSRWSDADWRKEVLSKFSGYRAYVEKNPEDLLHCGEVDEVPEWAIKASEEVVTTAMQLWDQAYHGLASELQEPDLAHVVIATHPWYRSVARSKISSKDNPVWDYKWTQLSAEQQQAAVSFGWNSDSWDNQLWFCPQGVAWSDLPGETQASLGILGETAESWDRWTS